MKTKEFKKVLVIQPDHIGDVLLATPMIRALRRRFPKAKIDVLVGSWAREIVEHSPDIDDVYVFNFSQFNRKRVSNPEKWFNFLKIKANKYDLAVMARSRNKLIRWFAWTAGIKNRIGFAVPSKDSLLTIKVKQENPREHVVLRNLRIAEALGADISNPTLVLKPSKEAEKNADALTLNQAHPLIGINPGAGTKAKQWSPAKFAQVAKGLMEKYNTTIYLTGGPGDVHLAKQIASKLPRQPVIAAGNTSLLDLAALGSRLDLFISNDSGPMHIIAAMGTPVIDLHSGTDYPSMWRPWGDQHTILTHAEECDKLPCFKTECDYFDHGCLELVSPEDVMTAADRYLD